MKFLPLIWAGLWRKPARTIFTFLSIVLAFVLFGLLTGVGQGFSQLRDSARVDRLMSDSRFGAPLPIAFRAQIERIPGVTAVSAHSGVYGYMQDPRDGVLAVATGPTYFQTRSELVATKEQLDALARTRTGAIILIAEARKYGWKVGDKITLNTFVPKQDGSKVWDFDVVAIIDDVDHPGTGNFFMVNYDYLDEARATDKGTVNRIITRIKDPERAAEISGAIDALFANSAAPTRTTSEKANVEAGLQSLGDINFLIDAVGGAVLFMLLFITGNSMTQSVRERIPEFGIMKTLGFTDRGVLLTVLAKSSMKFVTAAVIGLVIAKQLINLTRKMNLPPPLLSWTAVAVGVGLSLAAAVASAILPALRAKRLSIIDALAGR